MLGQEIGGVGDQQRENEQHVGAAHRVIDLGGDQPNHGPDHDAEPSDSRKAQPDPPRLEYAGQYHRGREPDAEQPGRVVDQALTAEDRRDPSRHAQPLENGVDGDGVGRGDNSAQQEAGGPRQTGERPVGDQPDRQDRECHEPNRKLQDRP